MQIKVSFISEVVKYTNVVFETDESVLNSEVSSFQRLLSTQMWYLRQMKVS